MYIYITLIVIPVVTNSIACESTSDRPKEVQQRPISKNSLKECNMTTNAVTAVLNAKSLPTQHPMLNVPRPPTEEKTSEDATPVTPLQLTKLAKTLRLGFDPTFSKVYFEPFERRTRPMILVLLRKNGIDPKHIIKDIKTLNVAELQSPYNDIGSFWEEQPGEPELVI